MKRYVYLLIILFVCLFINHLLPFQENLTNKDDDDDSDIYKVKLVKDKPTAASCKKYIKLVKKNTSDLADYESDLAAAQKKLDSLNDTISNNKTNINVNLNLLKAFSQQKKAEAQSSAAGADSISMS